MHIINQLIFVSRIRYLKKKESCFCAIEKRISWLSYYEKKKYPCFLFGKKYIKKLGPILYYNFKKKNSGTENKILGEGA